MESTTLFSSESALLLVMFLMVAVGFWLQRFKVFKVLGPALTVIVTGIILSNLKIVPVSSPTFYSHPRLMRDGRLPECLSEPIQAEVPT